MTEIRVGGQIPQSIGNLKMDGTLELGSVQGQKKERILFSRSRGNQKAILSKLRVLGELSWLVKDSRIRDLAFWRERDSERV